MVFSMKVSKDKAIKLVQNGEVIACVTDTIYGLIAKYNDTNAITAIFEIKKRPLSNPLIILIHDLDQLRELTENLPKQIENVAKAFWPGPLTIILPANQKKIPAVVRANLPTCAFRIPGNESLLSIIKETGPIVAPSANISTSSPAKNPKEIELVFGNDFPVYGDITIEENLPSTLIGLESGHWKIFREGKIRKDTLSDVLGYTPYVK